MNLYIFVLECISGRPTLGVMARSIEEAERKIDAAGHCHTYLLHSYENFDGIIE